jgi:hypothetical protein
MFSRLGTLSTPIRVAAANLPLNLQHQHADCIGMFPFIESAPKHDGWRRSLLFQNCLQMLLTTFSDIDANGGIN